MYECARHSNNKTPAFSDVEVLTVYLYGLTYVGLSTRIATYRFCRQHLSDFFPRLPSYSAFSNRLNRFCSLLQHLLQEVLERSLPPQASTTEALTDSVPVMTYRGPGRGRVAPGLVNKGYCAAKRQFFDGVRLHVLGCCVPGSLPHPVRLVIAGAAEHDGPLFRHCAEDLFRITCYADKAYRDEDWSTHWALQRQSTLITPQGPRKGQTLEQQQFQKAAHDLQARAVASKRQPIEALFSRLISKTNIQNASRVRSFKGLLVHIFAKFIAAYLPICLNP
jgi:hypothetical protein